MKKQAKSGQILLVVLLTSIILLTVGLAITSQTITDLNVTTQEQQYTRSFNAAEAGIEDLLGYDSGLAGVAGDFSGCTIEDPCSEVLPGQNDLNYQFGFDGAGDGSNGFETERLNGDALQVDLTDWGTDGDEEYTIYWSATDETPAALELIYFYNVGTEENPDIKIFKRLIADNDVVSCTENSEAENPTGSEGYTPISGGKTFQYQFIEDDDPAVLTEGLKFVRIKPLCAPTTSIAVIPGAGLEFPPQFYTAQVESNEAGNVAALEVQQSSQKSLPAIFDYTLFSGGDIQM